MSIVLDYAASDGWPKYQVLEEESERAPVCLDCGAGMFIRKVTYPEFVCYEMCCALCDSIIAGAGDLNTLLQMFPEIENG